MFMKLQSMEKRVDFKRPLPMHQLPLITMTDLFASEGRYRWLFLFWNHQLSELFSKLSRIINHVLLDNKCKIISLPHTNLQFIKNNFRSSFICERWTFLCVRNFPCNNNQSRIRVKLIKTLIKTRFPSQFFNKTETS